MNVSDKQNFVRILNATFAMSAKWQMPDGVGIEMWWRCLEKFTIDQVAHGFQAHLTDGERGQFQPMPADIIRHIEGGNKATREARAEYAWRLVLDNLNTYESAVFDDPAIHYAIKTVFGSWEDVGSMDMSKEAPFRRRDFVRAYISWKPGTSYPSRMIGRLERECACGESNFATHYIGDKDKCLAVEGGGVEGSLARIDAKQPIAAIGHK